MGAMYLAYKTSDYGTNLKRRIFPWLIFPCFLVSVLSIPASAQNLISEKETPGAFPVVSENRAAEICVDDSDYFLVRKAASFLQHDIKMVTGETPSMRHEISGSDKNLIIIGSLQQSRWIRKLAAQGKIDTSGLSNQWESYRLQVVHDPFPGTDRALIIVGSDRRGTAYGVFTLSRQMGVSPWYWWADVPVKKKKNVFVKQGIYRFGPPSVKYRGIFLNDEAPALSGWVHEKFGNFNHRFYEKVFELLLRLKANYLWPAMWGNAFNNDDTLNPVMADKYGIVMGTSHQEPMNQATEEWRHENKGPWDYQTNDSILRAFWRRGIENMDHRETIVTIGMRGDGDKPMMEGTNIALLEKIVRDQRKIISEVTGRPPDETPQDWALYKEVQDYYDRGMKVPDDVTLLYSDDNWGNVRRLPLLKDSARKGGFGMYYHFDYVGGPRNYKWLNTNNISRVWEQMHLAYAYGVKRIWIANVGDLKPMEFPISFFLDYAWNVKAWNEDNLSQYYTQWAAEQFGDKYAKEIGQIIQQYSQYNARRKPELLDAHTYSLLHYNESDRVRDNYNTLLATAEQIDSALPDQYRDAYFELVLHPVKACANLQNLYTAVAWNQYYSRMNDPRANQYAEQAKRYYICDSMISLAYNRLNGGKWNHMMDQTHIGYTYWQQPLKNSMPEVKYVSQDHPEKEGMPVLPSDTTSESLIPKEVKGNVFYEKNGYVSIEASHYTRMSNTGALTWKIIPGIGREGDGITSFPVTAHAAKISGSSPRLSYDIYTYDTGRIKIMAYLSPTLNFQHNKGLKYGISVDAEEPQTISINKEDDNPRTWSRWVANDIIIKESSHDISKPGRHTITFWRVSPAVVLQKLVVDLGGVKSSYLGPPETRR